MRPRDQAALARAALLALLVEAGLRVSRPARLAHRLGVTVGRDASPAAPRGVPRMSDSEARGLRAAGMLFGSVMSDRACLRFSLVAGRMLRRHGPVLRFGTARRDGTVHAHAWLEVGGVRIDSADATEFAPLKGADPK